MSNKVKKWLIADGISIAINTFIAIWLYSICDNISYQALELISKIVVIGFFGIVNIIILIFFFVYWWSDNAWTACKKSFKQKTRFLRR